MSSLSHHRPLKIHPSQDAIAGTGTIAQHSKRNRPSTAPSEVPRPNISDAVVTDHNHHDEATSSNTDPPAGRRPSNTIRRGRSRGFSSASTTPKPNTAAPDALSSPPPTISYFSPQHASNSTDVRSPPSRRTPGSSHGPPIALLTRNSSARVYKQSLELQNFQQQRLTESGLKALESANYLSANYSALSGGGRPYDREPSVSTPRTRSVSRHSSARSGSLPREDPNNSAFNRGYSDYVRDQSDGGVGHHDTIENLKQDHNLDSEQEGMQSGQSSEDLFIKAAQDSPSQRNNMEDESRTERRKSRLARSTNRQSLPNTSFSSPLAQTGSNGQSNNYSTPNEIKKQHARRLSQLPTPPNFRPSPRDASPTTFVGSESLSRVPAYGRRRPSYPDPPLASLRAHTYRPSNLQYSSSRDYDSESNLGTPELAPNTYRAGSRQDGTESVGSTTAPSTVWDELDELKSRIKKLELTGRIPTTSGAAISNGSAERPRTATTTVTTISSSPKHVRKSSNNSPSEANAGEIQGANLHPNLHDALERSKNILSSALYRALEATATEALDLAAMTSGAGPQGTAFTAASIINGVTVADRNIRRKADNMCRNLTDFCIALNDNLGKAPAAPEVPSSPAVARAIAAGSRRASLQPNSPAVPPSYARETRGLSVEPEGGEVPRDSPSRALDRIQARRSSLYGLNGSPRDRETTPVRDSNNTESNSIAQPSQTQERAANRLSGLSRAGTSLLRTRQNTNEDDEDPTLRAPSRAMTDFTQNRPSNRTIRMSRDYTANHPMPDLQSSPLAHTHSLRRPQGTVTHSVAAPSPVSISFPSSARGDAESHLPPTSSLLRDGRRRYIDRGGTPPIQRALAPYEKNNDLTEERRRQIEERRARVASLSGNSYSKTPSLAGSALGRHNSVGRRLRQPSTSIE